MDGSGNYLIVRDRHVARLNPLSTLPSNPEWVVFNEFVLSDNSYIVIVSDITIEMYVYATPDCKISSQQTCTKPYTLTFTHAGLRKSFLRVI